MKLNTLQFEQHLKQKTLGKVYIICGEEPFMVQETINQLRQKAISAGFKERLRLNIDNDTDWDACRSHAYTPPLFGQKCLLELHWKDKPAKAGQQFLVDYASHPSPHHIVLACMGRLDNKTEQTKWFKALEKASMIIPLWPLSPRQLQSWIMQRAQKQGLELSFDVANLLARAVEGNLSAAAQEIEKLSLSGATRIDQALIESMVLDQGCFTAFDLVDQSLAGHRVELLRILRHLQNKGSEPLMILGALTRELHILAKFAKNIQNKMSLTTIFTQYRVRLGRQDAVRHFLKHHTEQNCLQFILKAAEIDRIAKGALAGDVWEALEDFCLALTGSLFSTPRDGIPSSYHI